MRRGGKEAACDDRVPGTIQLPCICPVSITNLMTVNANLGVVHDIHSARQLGTGVYRRMDSFIPN